MSREKVIFATNQYNYLLEEITRISDENVMNNQKSDIPEFIEGIIAYQQFPDGEKYHRIETNIDGSDVFLIGGTPYEEDILEIYDLACAMVKYGAHTMNIIIPYFSYSTMERKTQPGEVVKSKTRSRILSMIPKSNRNRFIMIDLHSEGIPHYFEGDVITEQISCQNLIFKTAKEMAGDNFVLASTDSGRAKTIEKFANKMGVDAAYIFKKRKSGTETYVDYVNADVEDKKVVIYDDMIRTGGSLINAGKAYKDAGASEVYAIATHGVFPDFSAKKVLDSGVFEYIATTNTHPKAPISAASPEIENLQIISVADLIYNKIMNI